MVYFFRSLVLSFPPVREIDITIGVARVWPRAFLALLLVISSPPAFSAERAEDLAPEDPVIDGPAPPSAPAVVSRDDQGRVTLRGTRLVEPIVLDGQLTEPIYEKVSSISGFIQQEPLEGELATEQTEVWVFHDDDNLYVAARCWDSHPERIVANEMRRDNFNINNNANFAVILGARHGSGDARLW